MDRKIHTPANDLIQTAEEAKLISNTVVQKSILASLVSEDAKLTSHLQRFLNMRAGYEKLLKYPFDSVSQETLEFANYPDKRLIIGFIQRMMLPFVYLLNLLTNHCLVLGATGTGKTNLFYGIIAQCIRQLIPVIVFDKDKQDYRHLKRFFPNLNIFNIENFNFNPLQVPTGVNPKHWLSAFVQVFAKSNSLLDGSENLLLRAVSTLYEKHGIFQGSDNCPTLIDLYHQIKSYNFKGNYRARGYQDSILNRLHAYVALNREVYEYSKGMPIEWIAKNSFVLEVKSLTDRIARFTMSILLYALFMHRIALNERGNILRNLIVVDEAKWLAPPGHNDNLGFSPLTSVMSQSREVGIGLLIGDQTAQLEDSVFVNSRLKCCFRLGDGQDIEKVHKTMALSQEQADYITKLDTGECIIRIPNEEPFVIKTLKVNFE